LHAENLKLFMQTNTHALSCDIGEAQRAGMTTVILRGAILAPYRGVQA